MRPRQRRALRRRLHLDEAAVAGHHHVGVDLGGRVLAVVEVEQRRPVHDPARNCRNGSGQRGAFQQSLGYEAVARQPQGNHPAGDRGAARAAVGLQHVAVDVDGALAERREVDNAPQRAADQTLDLDGAPVRTTARGVALLALPGRGGEHPVLRRHPAPARAGKPAGHALLRRGGADHSRLAHRDQRRAGRRAHESRLDHGRAQVVGGAVVAALRAHAATRALRSTWTTSPSGICRKRVPSVRNGCTSPVQAKR